MSRKQSGRPPHKVGDRPGLNITFRREECISIGDSITVTIEHYGDRTRVNIQAPRAMAIRKIPLQKQSAE